MQVQPITNTNFGAKNTFLRKSKKALDPEEKAYYKSLYYEAMARMHYLKFRKANHALGEIDELNNAKNIFSFLKLMCVMANEKLNSAMYQADAYGKFPPRFEEADNGYKFFPRRFYNYKK